MESKQETFFNGRPTRVYRPNSSISKKIFAIAIISTALFASLIGGALVSHTAQSAVDQRLKSQPVPTQLIDTQTTTSNQNSSTSNTYKIPANDTTSDASASDHSEHHPDPSSDGMGGMTADDMYSMMESMDMYELMQNGTMDGIMVEMMPGMIELMSDEMKTMMMEMMMGNMTNGQNGMGNQTMIQEMDKMLQTMDKSLTILNTIVDASIVNGSIPNETLTLVTGSINNIMSMMDQLMQMIDTPSTTPITGTMTNSESM